MGCCTSTEKTTKPPAGTGNFQQDGGVAPASTVQQSQPFQGHRISTTQQPTNGAIAGTFNRELPPSPSAVEDETQVFVARFAYQARTAEDLSFEKGEKLKVIGPMDSDWWMAKSIKSGREGYIPRNYIALVASYEAEEWYFGDIARAEAEKWLLSPHNPSGTFLIRMSSSQKNSLSMSLRDGEGIKHYRIRRLDDGGYYIASRITFRKLTELVDHYQRDADGLAQKLTIPCPRVNQPMTVGLSYRDEWEIERSTLQFQKKLGQGNFGEVWSGVWNDSTPVAIKTLKPGTMEVKDFVLEAQVMKKIHHPNLLQLYAVCTLEEPIYIVTELMKHGSLLEYLRHSEGRYLTMHQMIDMIAQIAAGMAYLEEHSYIHRDLAARNVLVGEGNVCKVADFGLARVIKEDIYNPREGTKFPIKWTAPEAALYNRFSIKSDVWSFGVVIAEVITRGAMPYPSMNNRQVLEAVERGYRMPAPEGCPDPLYNIMLSCWKHEADDRPTFESLKNLLEDYYVSAAEGAYKEAPQ